MRSTLMNVTVVVASLLVALVMLEAVLRLRDGIPLLKFQNFVEERVSLTRVHAMAEYDVLLGWRVRGNQSARGADRHGNVQTWTTDEHGFRMNTDQVRSVPTEAIVAVGDSFAVGSEVSDDESWPAFLERALEEPVINAGAGAWGSDQIVLRAEQTADMWQPHSVIVSFLWQDILRSEYAIYAGGHKPYFSIEGGELVHHNNPIPVYEGNAQEIGWARSILGYSHLMTWATQRLGHDTWLISHALQYQRAHPNGTGIDISCRLLERLKQKADRDNFRLIFLMQYASNDFEANGTEVTAPPAQAVAVSTCAADDFGIETVDRWDAIKAIYDSDRARWRDLWVLQADDKSLGHMSRSGNELMAQHLLELLQ